MLNAEIAKPFKGVVVRTCFADSNADFNSPWAMGIVIAALPADSKSDQISKCGIGSGYVMIISI